MHKDAWNVPVPDEAVAALGEQPTYGEIFTEYRATALAVPEDLLQDAASDKARGSCQACTVFLILRATPLIMRYILAGTR